MFKYCVFSTLPKDTQCFMILFFSLATTLWTDCFREASDSSFLPQLELEKVQVWLRWLGRYCSECFSPRCITSLPVWWSVPTVFRQLASFCEILLDFFFPPLPSMAFAYPQELIPPAALKISATHFVMLNIFSSWGPYSSLLSIQTSLPP